MLFKPEELLKKLGRPLEKRAGRALFRFINGVDWFLRDPQKMIGTTPFEVVFQQDKLAVRRYQLPETDWLGETDIPLGTERLAIPRHTWSVPVVMIPPLMVKPFIFDLRPERSFVLSMLRAGYDVYLIDFGEPDARDQDVRLEDYVLDWLPQAMQAVRESSGSRRLTLCGYCMGGLFALMYTATSHDDDVVNLVTIASPIDSEKLGLLSWVVRHAHSQLAAVASRLGNIPGPLSSRMFKMLTPVKSITRYADLFVNMWNDEYVNGFDAMNQWVSEFIDYPKEAFQQFLEEFMKNNGLKEGTMLLGGKPVDLQGVKASLLAFAGETDKVVPPPAARAILDVLDTGDKEFRVVAGGHMGVFAGSNAPRKVWQVIAEWLSSRSGPSREG